MSYLGEMILNTMFNKGSLVVPTKLYVGLLTDSGEPTDGGYTRQDITGGFSVAVGGSSNNTVSINFPSPTSAWGTMTGIAVYDSLTEGNLLFYGPIEAFNAVIGSIIFLEPNDIQLRITGLLSYTDEIMNSILQSQPFTPPTGIFLALHTEIGEVVGGGYARLDITDDFGAATSNDIIENVSQINFYQPTIGWGSIVKGSLWDNSTGGNKIVEADFQQAFSAPPNQEIIFQPKIVSIGITVGA